jgi:hypothetical protein
MTLHERTGGLKGTALDMGSMILRDPSSWTLIAVNILVAVMASRRPPIATTLMTVYWIECIIVGLFNIIKLFFIPMHLGPEADQHTCFAFMIRAVGRILLSLVFMFHYGFILVVSLFLIGGISAGEMQMRKGPAFDDAAFFRSLLLPVIALTLGHAFSFVWNFLMKREYAGRTVSDQMIRPYRRVLVMFGILVVGGFLVSLFNLPELLLVVFLLFKITADLLSHFSDHRVAWVPQG